MSIESNYKLTQEQFNQLIDENTSRKTFKDLSSLATSRFDYIINKMASIIGFEVDWYDYANEGGDEYSPGHFDPDEYSSEISFTGVFKKHKNPEFDKYSLSFPTSWLYQDFENSLISEVNQFIQKKELVKQQKQQAQQQLQQNVDTTKQNILSKLSDDEKKFIFFNSPEAVQQNKQKDVSIKNLMEEKRSSILSKLSDDEKDFISFQSFNEVFKMIKANEKEAKIQSYKNLKKNKP